MKLCKWSVQNRPSPRLVQAFVIVVIAGVATVGGIAGAAVGQILTVNWPKGGER